MPFQWPPDYAAEFSRRINMINRLEYDPVLRANVMFFYGNSVEGCIAWINDFAVTFDPRNKPPIPRLLPFKLFPRQEDLVRFLYSCLNDKESGLIEKCRDMGASWVCVAFTVWLWLFHDGSTIGWGSRKEEYVDKKEDPKAIFPKIRQTLQYLPKWMLPAGYNENTDATYMKIINRANGSTITGEAGNNIGRGGRTTMYFKDESAHYDQPELIEAALGDNTDVQIDISSVNGTGNVFYRRRQAGEVWTPGSTPTRGRTRVLIMDWRDHPAKTEDWYNLRRIKAEAEGLITNFRQEVDRDYSGSVQGVIIPQEWVKAAIDAHLKLGIARDGEKVAAQDVADGGGDKNALIMREGVVAMFAQAWGGEADEAARVAIPIARAAGMKQFYWDSPGVGSGFKSEVNRMKNDPENPLPPSFIVLPWNGGSKVLNPEDHIIPDDPTSPTNEDFFANLKAQAWWMTRTRFYKTYRAVVHGIEYPHEELISISSEIECLHQLTLELSQPIHTTDKKGKTLVDKKPDGNPSPNLADGFVMCYCPTREVSIFDAL